MPRKLIFAQKYLTLMFSHSSLFCFAISLALIIIWHFPTTRAKLWWLVTDNVFIYVTVSHFVIALVPEPPIYHCYCCLIDNQDSCTAVLELVSEVGADNRDPALWQWPLTDPGTELTPVAPVAGDTALTALTHVYWHCYRLSSINFKCIYACLYLNLCLWNVRLMHLKYLVSALFLLS